MRLKLNTIYSLRLGALLFLSLVFNIGKIRSQIQPFSRNDSAYVKALENNFEIQTKANNIKEASYQLNELALTYWNHNNFKKAIEFYEKSLQLNHQLGNENGESMIHGNLGLLYADTKDYQKSLDSWQKVLTARRAFNNKEALVEALVNCSVSLNSLKRYSESLDMLEEASLLSREIPDQKRMLEALLKCYRNLSETYEKAGDREKATQYFDYYKIFSDKQNEIDYTKLRNAAEEEKLRKELAENQNKLKEQELIKKQYELRESSIDLLEATKVNQLLDSTLTRAELQLVIIRQKAQADSLNAITVKAELKRAQAVRNSFALAALSLVAISFFIYRNYIQVKRSRKLLAEKNEQIESQNKKLDALNKLIAKHNARMKQELDVGQEIQMSMLPKDFPTMGVDLYALLEPSREVGGDLYDFFMVDNDHLFFGIGDVSGKGVPAALFMAVTKTLVKTYGSRLTSPAAILTEVNRDIFIQNDQSMFVTYFLGYLNTNTGELCYSNAGHLHPILRELNTTKTLTELHGPVIGAVEYFKYKESKIVLKKRDKLILYTDGITEATNLNGEYYGETRLANIICSNASLTSEPLLKSILEDLKSFSAVEEQNDDITLLGLELM